MYGLSDETSISHSKNQKIQPFFNETEWKADMG